MKYKAIIFDLDGTIINTERFWQEATLRLMNKKPNACPQVKKQVSEQLVGCALPKSCQIIKDAFDLTESIEELILEKEQHALNLYQDQISYLHGFEDFFKKVINHNLKKAIATNSTQKTLAVANQEAKLHSLFGEHMYSMALVNKPKPNPDIFLYTADKLKIDPKDCVVIEDSITGVQAAKAADMFCIRIFEDGRPHPESEADLTVNTYHQIDIKRLLKI